ncbi:hypothetical protein C8R46DRAFT_1283444 [Mycena filopes]|nr:hypothetical protein C8R46DRAFT_1283444 [Mycena filopes]
MSSLEERPYNEDDLKVNKPALIKMVQRQQSKWPTAKFNSFKATVADITAALLDPNNGFTTNKPLITSPHPAKHARNKSVPVEQPDIIADSETEVRIVRIYLEDGRFRELQKTVAVLSLPVFDENCAPGYFRVLSKDVVSALQQSNSSLEIPPGKSSFLSDCVHPSSDEFEPRFRWHQNFYSRCRRGRLEDTHHGDFIHEMKFDPAVLEIPESLRIKLFVDNLAVAALTPKTEDTSTAAVIPLGVPSTSTGIVSDVGPAVVESAALRFLRGKLAERDGYQSFAAHRGRTVSNPDIVQDWQFAVNFKRDYKKIKTPVKIGLPDIQTALGIQSTWLTNAQAATGIIGTYGKVKEVAEALEREDDPPKGSIALVNFLTEWKKNHPA